LLLLRARPFAFDAPAPELAPAHGLCLVQGSPICKVHAPGG
jgi:hypothetical protein